MVLAAAALGGLGGWLLSASTIAAITADKAADRQRVVDASADLLTAVLEKLANVSHKKQVEKGLAIFEAARGVFAATANIHSIVLQDLSLCNPMVNGTFHNSTMP